MKCDLNALEARGGGWEEIRRCQIVARRLQSVCFCMNRKELPGSEPSRQAPTPPEHRKQMERPPHRKQRCQTTRPPDLRNCAVGHLAERQTTDPSFRQTK